MKRERRHLWLDTRDLPAPSESWLFSERSLNGQITTRPKYLQLKCGKCHRIDEYKAVSSGSLTLDVPVAAKKRDVWATDDSQLIVSRRFVQVVDEHLSADLFQFFATDQLDWFVAWPKMVIEVPPDAPVYKPLEFARPGDPFQIRGKRCQKCGRFRETTWMPMYFHVPAEVTFAGVRLEHASGMSVTYIVSTLVLSTLLREKVRGVSCAPEWFASDR